MAKKIIPATWQDFDGYGGEKSTYLHAFSEFIDNSIAAYLKEHHQKIDGLQVELNIRTFEQDGIAKQEISIIDNASGMDDDGLYEAIIPNNKKNKSDTQLNQYGIGMKLAAFWFGRSLKIVTKERKNKQYFLEINITDKNLMDKAEVDIQRSSEDVIKINDVSFESGTYIKLSNIRSTPNRIMEKNDCLELIKGLGWRYSDLLHKFSLTLNYTNLSNHTQPFKIEPFKIASYNLDESIASFSKKKNAIFDGDRYKKLLLKNVESAYLKHKKDIDSITDRNFYDSLVKNESLEFKYKCKIEGQTVEMHWGILALKATQKNSPYDYTELSGLTLLNNGRAIMHGPNPSNGFKTKSGIQIRTYSLEKKDAGSGQAVYRRLFGWIDLTGIENADRNKTQFIWGPNGEKNLSDEADKICSYLKDVLNAMQKAEKDEEVLKEKTEHKQSHRIKEKQIWEDRFDSKIAIFTPTYDGGNFVIDFNGDKITFMIQHCNASKQIAFDIEHDLINKKIVKIKINDDHYLWRDYIHRTDYAGLEFKVKLMYPLAIAFAICKIQYDDETHSPFSSWEPDKLPQSFDQMKFDDWFNKILEHLTKK